MKQPRKPTRVEKIILTNKGLDIKGWLVIRDMGDSLMIIHRQALKGILISKEGGEVNVTQNQTSTVS